MTADEVSLETNICRGLTMAIEAQLTDSTCDLYKCGRHEGGFYCCLCALLSICIPCCCAPSKSIRAAHPGKSDKSVREWSEDFGKILRTKGKPFFSSKGDAAGLSDWSLYGLLRKFVRNGTQAGKDFFSPKEKEIAEWYDKMEALYIIQVPQNRI